jgi:hypothetical protein
MLYWGKELAVYEEGRFVPKMDIAACERLLRAPERFTLQRYRLDESRRQMLYAYATLFDEAADPVDINQVMAVRPILSFVKQLPQYTILTSRLSSEAIAIRDTLLAAQEPQPLLFENLPYALDCTSRLMDSNSIEAYFTKLKRALAELQLAYDQLLQEIQKQLFDALLLPSDVETAREEITGRCQILRDWISDLRLKAFVQRLSNPKPVQREWIESVAALVTNKPPRKWNDQDVIRFNVALADITGQFRRTEEVALSKQSKKDTKSTTRVARLAVTDFKGSEQREVVQVSEKQETEVHVVVEALKKTLKQLQISRAVQLMAVTELAQDLLKDTDVVDG